VIGLSEKSPASSFYFGFSVEPIRNIAIVMGVNTSQEPRLASGFYDPGPSATHTSPQTKNTYQVGGFLVVAFNFSNFLQGLFK
jgi:hypothetical protein